jgi:hypothetical protein
MLQLIRRCIRVCFLRFGTGGCLGSGGGFRHGPVYRLIEKAQHLRMRVLGQRLDQLTAPQNLQQRCRRFVGREQ